MKNFWNVIVYFVYVRNVIVDVYHIMYYASLSKKTRNGKDVSDKIAKLLESELRYVNWEIPFLQKHDCYKSRRMLNIIQKTIGDEALITYYDMIYMYKHTALQVY